MRRVHGGLCQRLPPLHLHFEVQICAAVQCRLRCVLLDLLGRLGQLGADFSESAAQIPVIGPEIPLGLESPKISSQLWEQRAAVAETRPIGWVMPVNYAHGVTSGLVLELPQLGTLLAQI